MNDDELIKVFKVLSHCDNGCGKCVKNIFHYFGAIFPERHRIPEKGKPKAECTNCHV